MSRTQPHTQANNMRKGGHTISWGAHTSTYKHPRARMFGSFPFSVPSIKKWLKRRRAAKLAKQARKNQRQ